MKKKTKKKNKRIEIAYPIKAIINGELIFIKSYKELQQIMES